MLYNIEQRQPLLADHSVFVAPNATIIGSVVLEAGCSVWFNAVIRGDNDLITVGSESNVQDGAVLHTDPGVPLNVGRRVTIGHAAMLHGCSVGDGSLIGIQATVLNRAKIGSHCIVGAGALIAEGKEIPPESLVLGVPARVKRTLTQEELDHLDGMAQHYLENARRYAASFKPS
jgi:carbonic anhydrase/acetyltransferase-like protein (isoleucine patch superfamily)